ncbi:MAG: hypothetical protein ACREUW_02135 [Burkholderiales bacterium]
MLKLPHLILAAVLGIAAAFILTTTGALPDPVASKFGANDLVTSWMAKRVYLPLMLGLAVGMPLLMVGLTALLARRFPQHFNIPHREYWLTSERRAATGNYLETHVCWLACLMAGLIAGMHYAIVLAHDSTPPRLPAEVFWTLMGVFAFGMVWWMWALYARFRKPGLTAA